MGVAGAGPSPIFAVEPGAVAEVGPGCGLGVSCEQAATATATVTARPVAATSRGRRDGMSRTSHIGATSPPEYGLTVQSRLDAGLERAEEHRIAAGHHIDQGFDDRAALPEHTVPPGLPIDPDAVVADP